MDQPSSTSQVVFQTQENGEQCLNAPSSRAFNNNVNSKRWSDANRKITTLLSLSRGFKTLRDQYAENEIQADELQVIKTLGEGAFAKVELCYYCPRNQQFSNGTTPGPARIVAVKSLKAEVVGSSRDELNAFVTEVALMRKLKHKNIVGYVGMGTHNKEANSMFLVEEALPGGSAKQLVIRQLRQLGTRVYEYADALRWCKQIAEGMAYLHSCQPQVIHRDLKLENILLKGETASTSTAKIADFGLSALVKKKMIGEVVRASRQAVEANNLITTFERPSSRPKSSKTSDGATGRDRPAPGRRRRGSARRNSSNTLSKDPVSLEAKWNANFLALSRKVLAAEQDTSLMQRAPSGMSSVFKVNIPGWQTAVNQPWHGGHPNSQSSRFSTGGSMSVAGTGSCAGVAAVARVQPFDATSPSSGQALNGIAARTTKECDCSPAKEDGAPGLHTAGQSPPSLVRPTSGAPSPAGLAVVCKAPVAHELIPQASQLSVVRLPSLMHSRVPHGSATAGGRLPLTQPPSLDASLQRLAPGDGDPRAADLALFGQTNALHKELAPQQQQLQQQQQQQQLYRQSSSSQGATIPRRMPIRSPSNLYVRLDTSTCEDADLGKIHTRSQPPAGHVGMDVPGTVCPSSHDIMPSRQACAAACVDQDTAASKLQVNEGHKAAWGACEDRGSEAVSAAAASGPASKAASGEAQGQLMPNAFAPSQPCYRGTLYPPTLQPMLSAAGTAEGERSTCANPNVSGSCGPPSCRLAEGAGTECAGAGLDGSQGKASDSGRHTILGKHQPHTGDCSSNLHVSGSNELGTREGPHLGVRQSGGIEEARGSKSIRDTRKSEGGSRRGTKPTGETAKAEKRRNKIVTELRQVVDEHAQLSGRIGTLIYMSPEVYKSEHYDEKSDVYSFGVILFELFHRFLLIYGIAPSGNQNEVEQYAEQVSKGYRPPLGPHIPHSLGCLIRDCGAQNPETRPTMAVVLQRLEAIEAEGVIAKMDEAPTATKEDCSCSSCSVM